MSEVKKETKKRQSISEERIPTRDLALVQDIMGKASILTNRTIVIVARKLIALSGTGLTITKVEDVAKAASVPPPTKKVAGLRIWDKPFISDLSPAVRIAKDKEYRGSKEGIADLAFINAVIGTMARAKSLDLGDDRVFPIITYFAIKLEIAVVKTLFTEADPFLVSNEDGSKIYRLDELEKQTVLKSSPKKPSVKKGSKGTKDNEKKRKLELGPSEIGIDS